MLLTDKPLDYKTACIKAAAVALDSRNYDGYAWWFKRTKVWWSVEPIKSDPGTSEACWMASIGYERYPDPPHLMLHHAMKGALVAFLFDSGSSPESGSACFSEYDESRVPSMMQFSQTERLVAEKAPGWPAPEHHDWFGVYRSFRGSTLKVLTEAQQGRFRKSSDKYRLPW